MSYVIAHITDTHLSRARPLFNDNFAALATHLQEQGPDLVINTGDLALNGGDEREDLEAAFELHGALGLPWLAIPGNHDVGDNQETSTQQPINAVRRQRWLDVLGADYWVRDVPGWRLLGINSLLLGSDLAAAAEQEEFIAQVALGLNGAKLALFTHKPMCLHAMHETEVSGHQINPAPRARLLAALGDVRPALVCSGHLHEERERVIDGMHKVWGPAVAFIVPDWFMPPHGGVHAVGYYRIALEADGGFETRLMKPEGVLPHDLADFPAAYGDLHKLKATLGEKH